MPTQLDGASVLLTGASAGIGAALAPALARRGARVGIVGRRAERLDAVLAECRASGVDCESWVVDLGDIDAAVGLVDDAWERFDGLDVLVNNAAIPKRRAALDLTPADLEETMRVDFESPVRMTMALLPRLVERDRGTIVNVSSVGGRLGILHETAYCSAKFALCGWSESLALDLWNTGVDVRLIIPGPIDTDIWERPDNEPAVYDGPKEPPGVLADGIIGAIEGDGFEHYLPDLKGIAEFKTSDIDTFLAGAAAQLDDGDR